MLNKYGNFEPSKVMTKVNKDILEELKNIIFDNSDKIFEKLKDLKNKIYDMIFKEENILKGKELLEKYCKTKGMMLHKKRYR